MNDEGFRMSVTRAAAPRNFGLALVALGVLQKKASAD